MKFLFLFLILICRTVAFEQNMTDIIARNPLLAELPMFQNSDNSTIALPEETEFEDEEAEFINRISSKRSLQRETVSDNFDERYKQMNSSLFNEADEERGDLDYRDFMSSPDDVDLQNAIQEAEDSQSFTSSSSAAPFAASVLLFETPAVTEVPVPFFRTSPYFKSFPPPTTTPTFTTATIPTSSMLLSQTTGEEEKMFFNSEEDSGEDLEKIHVEDISDDDQTSTAAGISRASFQGMRYLKLEPFAESEPIQKDVLRRDENEVVQYNGKYSVSATKYYVDNRVDAEHYEPMMAEETEDHAEEMTVDMDPFAVEREMSNTMKMHSAKTKTMQDPLVGLEMLMAKDHEKRFGDEAPDNEQLTMETDEKGNQVERRQTEYRGQKTTVKLWNQNLYGHDLMRFPGAIFDDRIDEPRRKSDKRRAAASRIVLSSDQFKDVNPSNARLRKVIAGVATSVQNTDKLYQNENERKTTENVESVCFHSKRNTAIARTAPFQTEDNLSKLECLTKCAKSVDCQAVTYSVPLATCAMYDRLLEFHKTAIRSQGHSLHRKIAKTTLRCVRMFVSKEFFNSDEVASETESAPPFLRLVEKDRIGDSFDVSLGSSQKVTCLENQDVIFVRSDSVEASKSREPRNHVEISEDDCVFACLTNSQPGGGTSECTSVEYDKARGFCFLMTSSPGEGAMTPKPVNPVTTYEKICIDKKSADQCSGGQPVRYRQKVLIGHLIDAHSVSSASECVDMCIQKHETGCVGVMFYPKETTLNCILNDATNQDDPNSFYDETATIVDFFSIQECLGIREIDRTSKKRKSQKKAQRLTRLRRKLRRL